MRLAAVAHSHILALGCLNWNEIVSPMAILHAPMPENVDMVYDDILPGYF